MKKKIVLNIFIFCFLVFVSTAFAMHCGKNIIHVGNHKFEVIARCGAPVMREIVGTERTSINEWGIVEEWLYVITKYGHKQMYLVQFDGNGYVKYIKWLGETK